MDLSRPRLAVAISRFPPHITLGMGLVRERHAGVCSYLGMHGSQAWGMTCITNTGGAAMASVVSCFPCGLVTIPQYGLAHCLYCY